MRSVERGLYSISAGGTVRTYEVLKGCGLTVLVVKTWTDRRQTALRVVLNAVWKQGSEEEHDGDSNDFIRTTP